MTVKQGDVIKSDWDRSILEKVARDGLSGKLTVELSPD